MIVSRPSKSDCCELTNDLCSRGMSSREDAMIGRDCNFEEEEERGSEEHLPRTVLRTVRKEVDVVIIGKASCLHVNDACSIHNTMSYS